MSLDPVQVMKGQDPMSLSPLTGSNGDSKASWDDNEGFCDSVGSTKKPKTGPMRRARKVEGGVFFPKPENAVTIAVSSRVLFRTEKEQKVFEEKGVEEYLRYQVEHENEPLAPGPAFPFVKALEAVNAQLRVLYPDSEELFDIVLVTYNHAHVGVRLINTINHHNLFIERFCMTGGSSPVGYLKAWQTNLYLSADPKKVQEALAEVSMGRGKKARLKSTEAPPDHMSPPPRYMYHWGESLLSAVDDDKMDSICCSGYAILEQEEPDLPGWFSDAECSELLAQMGEFRVRCARRRRAACARNNPRPGGPLDTAEDDILAEDLVEVNGGDYSVLCLRSSLPYARKPPSSTRSRQRKAMQAGGVTLQAETPKAAHIVGSRYTSAQASLPICTLSPCISRYAQLHPSRVFSESPGRQM